MLRPAGQPLASLRRTLWLTAALACLVSLLAVSPARGAPSWLPAQDLSHSGRDATNPAVAMDEAGDTVVVWERQSETTPTHNLQVSTRGPGEAFSAPGELSATSTLPQVAMTPAGEAVAAWRHFDGENYVIQVAIARSPGGSFSAPHNLSTIETAAAPQGLRLAVNAAGAIAVTWLQKDPSSPTDPNQFSVVASVRATGGGFSAPQVVSPLPLVKGNNSSDPELAIDEAGDVTAVWDYFDGTGSVIQTARRAAGGEFETPQTLTTDADEAFSPDVAIAPDGDTIAVWSQLEGSDRVIVESSRPAGGAFGAPLELSEAGGGAFSPQVAISPGGNVTVAWERVDLGGFSVIQASTGTFNGSFGVPVDLSATGANAFDPSLAIDSGGAATVVWRRSEGGSFLAQGSIRPPGGGFSPAFDLSAGGEDVVRPLAAMDAAGDATVVWSRSDGTSRIVQAAGYDADPPTLRDLSIPSRAMVGIPVSFSAHPFDVWPIASTTFDFGDGDEAGGSSVSHTYRAQGTYRVTVQAEDAAGTAVSGAGTIQVLPSNEFSIGRVSFNRRRGTATIEVSVPWPGQLILYGKPVRRVSRQAHRAARLKMPIAAQGPALRRLSRRGHVKVSLAFAFTPAGGVSLIKHKKVTLIRKLR
jgi:PKD domain